MITLNGTTGITTPGITNTGTETVATQVISPIIGSASGSTLSLQSNGTTNATLDTNGNFGLGVAPSAWSGFRALQIGGATSLWSPTSGNGSSYYSNNIYYNGSNRVYIQTGYATEYQMTSSGTHAWFYATSGSAGGSVSLTQAMEIDTSGNLLVGTTSPVIASSTNTISVSCPNGKIPYQAVNQGQSSKTWQFGPEGTGGAFIIYSGASVGQYMAYGSQSWTGSSDARLKNITGIYTNPLKDISQIQAVKFTWKSDPNNIPQVGVIAQSVQTVVPEAISEMVIPNSNDETTYLGVRYTELIPLLIASVQELSTQVTALQAQVTALQPKS
jgi:hypothetical protein